MKNAVVENNKVMTDVIFKKASMFNANTCGHFQDQYWIIQMKVYLNWIIDFINPDLTELLQVILYFGKLAFITMLLFLGKVVAHREF